MPEKETIERAQEDAREGKSPSTQAGEFVREEIHHVREGKHGVSSPKQAIAIGLSKARKAGVKLPPPPAGSASSQQTKGGVENGFLFLLSSLLFALTWKSGPFRAASRRMKTGFSPGGCEFGPTSGF